ncbi:hypothetical protein BH11MYX2_BH11MYX2_00700 [soil metagenome]
MADPLEVLLDDGVIDEVMGRIKSGKEATISMVRRGGAILAAKVYKDRDTRSFKNNSGYKEGRKVRNTRTQRAMDSGGKFGRDSAEQAWKSAEADALYRLAGTGVRTPAPVMFYEGVLLMELVLGPDGSPAPRLEEISLEKDAVLGIYCDLVAQLIALLCCDMIHGDLSPYNILLATDGPTIIDFPQVISAAHNTRAEHFFLRDFDNVHSFLASFDPALAIHRVDGRAIWQAYVRRDLTPEFVPPPPPPIQPRRTERVFEPRRNEPRRNEPRRNNGGPFPPRNGPPQARPPQARPPQARPPQARPPQAYPSHVRAPEPVAATPRVEEPQPDIAWKESDWAASPPRPPAPPPPPKAPAPRPYEPRGPAPADRRPNDSRSDRRGPATSPSNGPRGNDPRSNAPRPNDSRSNGPRQNEPRIERAPLKADESPLARRREVERSEYRARDPNQPAQPPRNPATSGGGAIAAVPPGGGQRRRRRRFGS